VLLTVLSALASSFGEDKINPKAWPD